MPRGKLVRDEDPLIERLTEDLRSEWENESSDPNAPIIVEQGTVGFGSGQSIHLYVFWKDWESLSQHDRSEIILNVYEGIRGQDNALRVTIAMGLTPIEAKRMGIQYEVETAQSDKSAAMIPA